MIAGLVIIWLGVTARLIRVAWTRLSKYVYKHMETFEKAWEEIRDQEAITKNTPKK
jgi:hypothetical protein